MRTSLPEIVKQLAGRFPAQNYGWANAARSGRLEKCDRKVVLVPARSGSCFDCASSSREAARVLQQEGWPASAIGIQVPFAGGGKLFHYLLEVTEGSEHLLIGFTPLDRLMGIDPLQRVSSERFALLSKLYRLTYYDADWSGEKQALVLSPNSFPFRTRERASELIYSEIKYRLGPLHHYLTLRASAFNFDRSQQMLVERDLLGATYAFSRFRKSLQLFPDFWQEISANRQRWSFSGDFSPVSLNRPWPIIRAMEDDWPDFSRLIAQLL